MGSVPREDIFRLPPLTPAEATAVYMILVNGVPKTGPASPALHEKINRLAEQIRAHNLVGKKVCSKKHPNERGEVVGAMTGEESYERDWEDMDDFDETKRGLMFLTVKWDPDEEEGYEGEIERGYSSEELLVLDGLPPDAERTVLSFAKLSSLLGPDSEPTILNFQPHPSNGWLFRVRDMKVEKGLGPVKYIQLTDNECEELGGLTTRDVTPR